MPDVILSTIGGAGSQFFDNNGNVLAGGKLYTYSAGTTTPAATYTDSTGTTPAANPVVLDSAGRVPGEGVWIVFGTQYKLTLTDSADVAIRTWDNFPGAAEQAMITGALTDVAAVEAEVAAIRGCYVKAARLGSDQTLVSTETDFKLMFNSEVLDVGNNYDPTTGNFVAPAAGTYLVKLNAEMQSTGDPDGDLQFAVNVNGSYAESIVHYKYPVSALIWGNLYISGSSPIRLDSGDIVEVYIYINSTKTWYLKDDYSYIQITRIS